MYSMMQKNFDVQLKVFFMAKIILTQIFFPNTVKIDCNIIYNNKHVRNLSYSFTIPSKTMSFHKKIAFSFPLSLIISI